MRSRRVALTLTLTMLVAGCGEQISDKYVIANKPATLEEIPGSSLKKVVLTDRAVTRVGIETTAVTEEPGGALIVPSGALWMDLEGTFWVYTVQAPNTYLRHAVTVDDDDGNQAWLSAGPPPGTPVVTVGVPELYGEEIGVGK